MLDNDERLWSATHDNGEFLDIYKLERATQEIDTLRDEVRSMRQSLEMRERNLEEAEHKLQTFLLTRLLHIWNNSDVEGKNPRPKFTVPDLNVSIGSGDWLPGGDKFIFTPFATREPRHGLYLLDLGSGYWYHILSGYYITSVAICGPRCPW